MQISGNPHPGAYSDPPAPTGGTRPRHRTFSVATPATPRPGATLRRASACYRARVDHGTQTTRPAPAAGRIKLVAAARHGNAGDQGQANSIVATLERKLAQGETTTAARISRERMELRDTHQTSSAEQLAAAYDELATALRNGDYDYAILVVAGSGDQLAPSLGRMPHQDGLITVFSGHQLTDDIRKADKLPMYTALPGYDITARQKARLDTKTTLILVQGVAHSLSAEKLAETVQQYHAKGYEPLPPVDADSVGIVLGGDAPDCKRTTAPVYPAGRATARPPHRRT
jgi:hypothetical protein